MLHRYRLDIVAFLVEKPWEESSPDSSVRDNDGESMVSEDKLRQISDRAD